MIGIAAGGLVVNLLSLWILHEGKDANLNMRGAWLHVGDRRPRHRPGDRGRRPDLGFGWQWADPVASVLISLLVVYRAWSLLKEATGVLMEGAPAHIDVEEVHGALVQLPGVIEVHDLHVWTITSGMESISAHVVGVEDRRFDCEVLGQAPAPPSTNGSASITSPCRWRPRRLWSTRRHAKIPIRKFAFRSGCFAWVQACRLEECYAH